VGTQKRDELSVAEARSGSLGAVRVEGPVGVHGACVVGHRLLANLNDGAQRLLLDLSAAEPVAGRALLGTLMRIDRYAAGRGARLVVVSGAATEQMLDLRSTRGLLTIASTRAQAEAMLGP
jgi:hypothetical protein